MSINKYRAWHKVNKEWIDLFSDVYGLDAEGNLCTYYVNTGELELQTIDAEVNFYIGADDMKGNPIYNGDIIKREFEIGREIFDPESLGFVDYEIEDSGYFIGVVNYRPSEGYILNSCKKFNYDEELISKRSGVKIYPQYALVVGNIYEMPELLGDENE